MFIEKKRLGGGARVFKRNADEIPTSVACIDLSGGRFVRLAKFAGRTCPVLDIVAAPSADAAADMPYDPISENSGMFDDVDAIALAEAYQAVTK